LRIWLSYTIEDNLVSLLQLFRFLFPSWQFFDQFGHVPFLYLRYGNSPDVFGTWQKIPEEKKRKFSQLFLASKVNYHHFMSTLLHELVRDFLLNGKIEEFNESLGKKIIQELVDCKIKELQKKNDNLVLFYQFKISTNGSEQIDFYTSAIEKWSEA
jgi:hypothetical protein